MLKLCVFSVGKSHSFLSHPPHNLRDFQQFSDFLIHLGPSPEFPRWKIGLEKQIQLEKFLLSAVHQNNRPKQGSGRCLLYRRMYQAGIYMMHDIISKPSRHLDLPSKLDTDKECTSAVVKRVGVGTMPYARESFPTKKHRLTFIVSLHGIGTTLFIPYCLYNRWWVDV